MKGFSVILFAVFFLLSTSGITVTFHQCKMKGLSLSLSSDTESCCGKMGLTSGCCKNETRYFNVEDKYFSSTSMALPVAKVSPVVVWTSFLVPNVLLAEKQHSFFTLSHAPPDNPVALPILYRAILI